MKKSFCFGKKVHLFVALFATLLLSVGFSAVNTAQAVTPIPGPIAGQTNAAPTLPVISASDLSNYQVDVSSFNLVDNECVEAWVVTDSGQLIYAGTPLPDNKTVAHFDLNRLGLSAGTHTLAFVFGDTNAVRAKTTFTMGGAAPAAPASGVAAARGESKIAKTAGDSAAAGFIAFALILTAAGATAATRRKNNA